MYTTRVVLSFDDGRRDNFRVAMEELVKRKLPATFNITSGYIEKTIELDELCPNEPMTVEEVVELSKNSNFEIAGHGYAHLNTIEDWEKGIHVLKKWLGNEYFSEGYGVASPHSVVTNAWITNSFENREESNIKYIRTGLKNQFTLMQRGISKVARLTGDCKLMYAPIKESLKHIPENSLLCYSVPILNPHSYKQVEYIIDKTIQKNGDIILMLHSILKNGEEFYDDLYSWDYDKFVKLCDYLYRQQKRGLLKVETNLNIV